MFARNNQSSQAGLLVAWKASFVSIIFILLVDLVFASVFVKSQVPASCQEMLIRVGQECLSISIARENRMLFSRWMCWWRSASNSDIAGYRVW